MKLAMLQLPFKNTFLNVLGVSCQFDLHVWTVVNVVAHVKQMDMFEN